MYIWRWFGFFALAGWAIVQLTFVAGSINPASAQSNPDQVARGAYLVSAGGCMTCHTEKKGAPFSGGRALKTPFGTFFSPNITADTETGIGSWTDSDFVQALREGVRPDGAHYFPVFPYTTYMRMTRDDALAIKAYLFSLAPVSKSNKNYAVGFPFSWRFLQTGWKMLFFRAGELAPDTSRTAEWNRGAYLVEALSHCGEYHSPRNIFGGLDREMWLAGTVDGPEGETAPNITPDKKTGIGEWSEADIVQLFRIGFKPDFDDVQRSMAEAIEDGLKHLTDADLKEIAVYLRALPAIANAVKREKDG